MTSLAKAQSLSNAGDAINCFLYHASRGAEQRAIFGIVMTDDQISAHDDATAAEERRAALGFVTEAFAEAILAGVDGPCFAHAALFTAFQELVCLYGEDSVARFAETLPERLRLGEFSVASRH